MNTHAMMIRFFVIFFLYPYNFKLDFVRAEVSLHKGISILTTTENKYMSKQCFDILHSFSQAASNLTMCSILNARPVRLCEKCVYQYVDFHNTYEKLVQRDINGTSCKSVLMSQDRLNVILQYHDSILAIWEKGNCNSCFDWTDDKPVLKNDTIHFNKLFNDTIKCIKNPENNGTVCEKCMQFYIQLDVFYSSLSTDSIGVDSVCMDIVDSMNTTRSIWSNTLNCCKLRISPEIVFLCSAGLISFLPLVFYLSVRFCGPIRDLPKVLKQSRIKQTILRSVARDD